MPTQVYRVVSRAGLGTGDTHHIFAGTERDASEWKNVANDAGEDKSGNRRETSLIYALGPTVEDPGYLSIPVGATINSAKLTFLPTVTQTPTVEFVLATMLPDGRWNVPDHVDPKHYLSKLPARLTGSVGTIGQSNATINTSSLIADIRRYSSAIGCAEVGQIIVATATDTLVSSIANVSRNGTAPSGVSLWCEVWSVDGSDNKLALLATSALIPAASVPNGFDNPTTFTFSGGPTLTSGTRYLVTYKTDQAVGDAWLICGTLNASVTEPFVTFGTFDSCMWGSYTARTEFPLAFVGATDTPSAARFGSSALFAGGTWTNNVPLDITQDLVTLLQNWIDSPHYSTGGRVFFAFSHTLAGSASLSERLFTAWDSAVSDGVLLEVTWTDPPPPLGFPAACVHASARAGARVLAGALAPARVRAIDSDALLRVGAAAASLVCVDEAGATARPRVSATAEACPE